MNGPLEGLLVVALEQAVAAPFCSSRLADAGARVIKVERIDGDFARYYDSVVHGESAYFVWLNRGKESVCLDIKTDEDRNLLHNLIKEADVFMQNLAPGAAARAGLDSALLRRENSRLITVDISGYGETGEHSEMKAYDLLIQCESGLASVTGNEESPGRVGVSICDIACGMYAHSAILEALIERQSTGEGANIKVSLFHSVADWMTVPLLYHDYSGGAPERTGLKHPSIAPYGAYRCGDGGVVVIGIQNDREWRIFCEQVLFKPELAVHELLKNNVVRCTNRYFLDEQIDSVFDSLSKAELIDRLRENKIAFGSLNSVADLSSHPQLQRIEVDTRSGPVLLVAPPVRTTGKCQRLGKVPALGEHTESIRMEFA